MGKSDYYTIVAKILVYLYKKYKRIKVDEDYILPYSKAFPIPEEQLKDTIGMMEDQGFIKGEIVKDQDEDVVYIEYHSLKITPAGIDHLRGDSTIRKICETLKEAAPIIGLFM